MRRLITIICAACTLVVSSFGAAQADSSNFAGPYVGLQALGLGAEFSGSGTSSQATQDGTVGSPSETDEVQVGAVAASYGIEAGYAMPLGSSFILDIGAQYLSGEGKISHQNTDAGRSAGNVSFKFDDHVTVYMAPTIVLSDTSSMYVKLGLSEADIGVTGDITTPANLSGTMWAVGTRTVLESGIFIRTEAGYTEYNGISASGKGSLTAGADRIAQGTTFSAEPTIVHGNVSLGFRF